jgi:hypothetical protein
MALSQSSLTRLCAVLVSFIAVTGCRGGTEAPSSASIPQHLSLERLSTQERRLVSVVDRLARGEDGDERALGDRLLETTDLQQLVHSLASEQASSISSAALDAFDLMYESKGATETYAALSRAYVREHSGESTPSASDRRFAAIQQALFQFSGMFPRPRQLLDGSRLVDVSIQGRRAHLYYRSGDKVQIVNLDLQQRPDGSLRIAGAR